MSKISLTDLVKKSLSFEGKEKGTLLGIGPMSKLLIKATMLLAKKKDFPVMFIASRNQVDAKELGGGYVCNWDQKGFSDAIKGVAEEVGFDGLYFLCRDHGGPWQRDNERNAHLPEEEAMKLGKQSYLEDLINGFDLLHIDPTKDPYVVGKVIDMDVVLRRTVELIQYVEDERNKRGLPAISYEVGTEETNGGLTSTESYDIFIKKLTEELDSRNLPHPCFIVGQTGTLTRLTENVGHFDAKTSKQLSDTAKKYSVGLKEHNGDYLDEALLLQHPSLGITAMNVAPEFGTVETEAYLKLIEVEDGLYSQGLINKKSNLKNVIEEEAVKCRKWEKWVVDDTASKPTEEILKDRELTKQITQISGHYTFNNDVVKAEIENLFSSLAQVGIDGEKYVVYKIQESIDRYVQCFNMEGFTSRILSK
ncbi:MAG: class II D-tagatose-bisphosphate aldolase, non-catalytic subunit [Clostridium sp.]|jgi:tagatose-1,6-bisphosphate aldolase non-catalytic subunit AgaZ/GatZ|uniref:class II D-tagatose-bisphosphate aldolase non-catalytic subunit n=1 Tax=Clostridium sp. TaxID=1506 RepID=UPI0025BC1844|nr:class II D-tagatose-bisphosphate aldolase, non-catalytic subunit [Clostridium sp.]MCH3964954.1 class II D-tagatose-bisphosphate aldolase, non-catalytic subunit [Clostridium sp.]MCI1716552.1 class II D-tagatose-bisphosphate aldolase, non-catalytic subunit [Clostridium sp.]MCI1800966.1 class II D-tagatose-bisphosphate aldolase, non-catalytic subunit [Clostridium sp.]MCI1814729.1 class II D-tagatose-bisphosphate aldolase, non-catalytic subunit [Clostridium sp.]MCI1871713.1 class II D-tagatose-